MIDHNITLTNGRIVTHRPLNGAQEAIMADGAEMSHGEWEDYCARVVGHTPKKQRFYKTARATVASAFIAVGNFVAVRYSHTGTNGVDWYDVTSVAKETAPGTFESFPCGVAYPAHHLTDFCL
jgi:hypothetical protein